MLTYAAWGIHETLITQEGIDPNSEEYYTELDRRLQTEFPSRFQNSGSASQIRQQRAAPAVALQPGVPELIVRAELSGYRRVRLPLQKNWVYLLKSMLST